MSAGIPCPTPILQFFGNNGQPLAGGSILTQIAGQNAPVYQDPALRTPLANPIPLNSRGEIATSSGPSQQLFLIPGNIYTFTLLDSRGNQVWVASNVGQETDIVEVNVAAYQTVAAAVSYALANGYGLYFPAGRWPITGSIAVSRGVCRIRGDGPGLTILQPQGGINLFAFSGGGAGGGIQDLSIDDTNHTSGIDISIVGYNRAYLSNIDIINIASSNPIYIQDQNVVTLNDIWMNGLPANYFVKVYGSGIGASNVVKIDGLIGGIPGTGSSPPYGLWLDGDCSSIKGGRIDFDNCYNGLRITNSGNFTNGPQFIFLDDVECENCTSDGIYISGGTSGAPDTASIDLTKVYTQGNAGRGCYVDQYARNVKLQFAQNTDNQLAGVYTNGSYVTIHDGIIAHNGLSNVGGYPAIEIGANSFATLVKNNNLGQWVGRSVSTQNYAVIVDAGAEYYDISGNEMYGNLIGYVQDNANFTSNSASRTYPNIAQLADQSFNAVVPISGFSLTIGLFESLILRPVATLSAGSIFMPANPVQGQKVRIQTSQTITSLFLIPQAGQTFDSQSQVTTLPANTAIEFAWAAGTSEWYRTL